MSDVARPLLAPHRSIRLFKPAPLPPGMLERLVAEAQRAPTDATGQMYSFVRVLAGPVRERLAVLCGDQEYVASAAEFVVVCADLYRVERTVTYRGGQPGAFPATGLHFAIIDAALAAQRMIDAAEAIGLGTCCIGGVVNALAEVVELLALPRLVLPLFGVCVGEPAEQPRERPRVALGAVLHEGRYRDQTDQEIEADLQAMARTTRSGDWMKVLGHYFTAGGVMERREDGLRGVLESQGFAW